MQHSEHSMGTAGPSALGLAGRFALVAATGAMVGLAIVFAAVAAAAVGLIVLGAALAIHFAPRATDASLEARRTPVGWVVETSPRR